MISKTPFRVASLVSLLTSLTLAACAGSGDDSGTPGTGGGTGTAGTTGGAGTSGGAGTTG